MRLPSVSYWIAAVIVAVASGVLGAVSSFSLLMSYSYLADRAEPYGWAGASDSELRLLGFGELFLKGAIALDVSLSVLYPVAIILSILVIVVSPKNAFGVNFKKYLYRSFMIFSVVVIGLALLGYATYAMSMKVF